VILLDTDVLSIIQQKRGVEYTRLVARLNAIADQPVCVSVISLEEQTRGWLAYVARARTPEQQVQAYGRLQALWEDFQTRPMLGFDQRAAEEFRNLRKRLPRQGAMDLKIAAIAVVHNALLVSKNLKDYEKVPGLRVEDWTIPATA
jgi:tRNA(fMet)-specific endonuclease VapC